MKLRLLGLVLLGTLTVHSCSVPVRPAQAVQPVAVPIQKECTLKVGDKVYAHLVGEVCDSVLQWTKDALGDLLLQRAELQKRLYYCDTL